MSSHTRGPRKRTRKPRPGASRPGRQGSPATAKPERRAGKPRRGSDPGQVPPGRAFGERPHAPWHPLPLSETLILAGAIATVVGFTRRSASVPALLLAGIAATALGAIEVSWREHRSGYRSHTLLLAFLPVVVFHTVTVLVVDAFATFPRALNVALLALDVALFFLLFRVLRARFLDARARVAGNR